MLKGTGVPAAPAPEATVEDIRVQAAPTPDAKIEDKVLTRVKSHHIRVSEDASERGSFDEIPAVREEKGSEKGSETGSIGKMKKKLRLPFKYAASLTEALRLSSHAFLLCKCYLVLRC